MIDVETAIRAYVVPKKKRTRSKRAADIAWRHSGYGERTLTFDTETTTDFTQRLLFGAFRVHHRGQLRKEGLIIGDSLSDAEKTTVESYAKHQRLKVWTREAFVEKVFYPEVYRYGTLLIGFNLPFDLSRIAVQAGCGRGKNRRKFRFVLSRRIRWPHLTIEAVSGKAAFIEFVPKKHPAYWEKPFFKGRFLDLSTLSGAFTGERHTLARAGKAFGAHTLKLKIDSLGSVDRQTITYCRWDVRATYALYLKLREEYSKHPFATFANEREAPAWSLYMGRIYSSASIAKAYMHLIGFNSGHRNSPHNPKVWGYAAASYMGGRAEVRVRNSNVPVRVVDFTSMYPTVFILQNLQSLLRCNRISSRIATVETRKLLEEVTIEDLYDPTFWPLLNRIVLIEPNGAIVPVRMKMKAEDPYTIAVTHLWDDKSRWYTLADVIAGKLLGGPTPQIVTAIAFEPVGRIKGLTTVKFRGAVSLGPDESVFKTVVEQRQIAKRSDDPEVSRLNMGLKLFANSGSYGVHAEVNVTPHARNKPFPAHVFSDTDYDAHEANDEAPGAFYNPIIASLTTGGARLMLAMLESEVNRGGGVFAFCDTDSLAIVSGTDCPSSIPCLNPKAVDDIVRRFDLLNPYDRTIVPSLLKLEYADKPGLRCYAVSAKRYVLFTRTERNRISIVKASESGLGAVLGRTERESTARLARRIWYAILSDSVRMNREQRKRVKQLCHFDIPFRRKMPITQPAVLQRSAFERYNRPIRYDHRIKPFGFIQIATPATVTGDQPVPIAPFERIDRAERLPWVDLNTGSGIVLDWNGEGYANEIPVMRLDEYIAQYRRHPESKGADQDGRPSTEDTIGLLGRLPLRSWVTYPIGKELDRLDEDDGSSLLAGGPFVYEKREHQRERDRERLEAHLRVICDHLTQIEAAKCLQISDRRFRDILKNRAVPQPRTRARIQSLTQNLAREIST